VIQNIENVDATSTETLLLPPIDLLQDLFYAANIGDIQKLNDVIASLEQTDPAYEAFIQQTRHFTKTYQIQKLCDWLEDFLQ